MSHYKVTNDHVALDSSGAIRVSPQSSDPLAGSFIDHDGRRKKYLDRRLFVWQNDAWVPDVTRATDSSSSDGSPPQGAAIRRGYLDAIEQMRLKQLEPARTGANFEPGQSADAGLTPKQKYLAELARRGSRG